MRNIPMIGLLEAYVIGGAGGYIFYLGNLPLPWVLGALTFVLLYQGIFKRQVYCPDPLKQSGFLVLGLFFGLYFTKDTLLTVAPYIFPYVLSTIALITVSIINSVLVTKWIAVDKITSVFGSIPGGLSEMVIASESLKAKSSLVVIFQTVRLLTVLFMVPFVVVHTFPISTTGPAVTSFGSSYVFGGWLYVWFIPAIIGGILLRNKIPAGIVIVPLALTALINISLVEMATLPPLLLVAAQITVGIGMGKGISFGDLKLGGKYCFVYFGLTVTLILVSFGLGAILASMTSLNLPTAILSVAPGGLIEMVLTATSVGGDPAVVSSLQLIRLLFIIIFVPPLLKWYFGRKVETSGA
ncbi:AbrB family transcriptional regulator [Sutcliffiella horikoshii]|uniref:AbrB family transcriptional regulator n=1 Tax=Sutcliffiella horikoshii TaxID=79883 RepID=UPI00203EC072|nr:AbrB family transcriptional regulator [Sutcliffiella horikoshii]MCM3616580.1 AbrB family transcriptional regulator [Sutcliffiella horikoshii]